MRILVVKISLCMVAIAAALVPSPRRLLAADRPFTLSEDDGYRGIWYAVGKTNDQYAFKYSGGMATYPQQHVPTAVYAPAVSKTYFVYGGSPRGARRLLHMVSYFDHAQRSVPRPRILLDKETADAHDNPTLAIDPQGHLWVFSNSHGTSRPAFIHRSVEPYSITSFERVLVTNFSYSQPWVLGDEGFFVLHTRYSKGRGLFWMTSRDGRTWSVPSPLAHFAQGHYQVSWSDGRRVATAFNYHPPRGGLDARTNLYFLETSDAGRTWRTADNSVVDVPLAEVKNAALVRDYESERLLVYLKCVRFDAGGCPVILFLTSRGHEPGPDNDPRTWHTARWTGQAWDIRDVTTSDHNYDFGTLSIEPDGSWQLVAPTDPGPQPYCTGGQIVMWTSGDEGRTWQKVKQLTRDTARNHSFVRRPIGAHDDFCAFWADGNAREPSDSSLYFTDRLGTHVWRLPARMDGERAQPEIAW